MKKTLIITLLVALVLGIFTACNGEVYSDLVGKKTVKLEIPSTWVWNFTNGTKELVVEVPSECKTWADLLTTLTDETDKIKIVNGEVVYVLGIFKHDYPADYYDKLYFFHGDYPVFGLVLDESKAYANPQTISSNDNILIGKTYILTAGDPQ